MNSIDIGKKIKELRNKCGLTQQQLADKMCMSRDAIAKWELNKNTPPFPYLLSLCTLLNGNIKDFYPELVDFIGENKMLENLPIIDDASAKSVKYEGLDDVYAGYLAYMDEYDARIKLELYELEQDAQDSIESSWFAKNSFIFMIHKKTKEIVAIRDYGRTLAEPADFLFITDYIPFSVGISLESKDCILKTAERALKQFDMEIENALKKVDTCGKKKLFIYRYYGTNNYAAWSLEEQKILYIYHYKEYRKNFGISDADCVQENSIIYDHDYDVCTPSEELIKLMGLKLDPDIWTRKMAWDKWDQRNEKEDVLSESLTDEDKRKTYVEAISLINLDRRNYQGYDVEYAKLENRIARLERLYELHAPDSVINKEFSMIRESICTIKSNVSLV